MTPSKMSEPPILKLERTFRATPEKLWAHWMDPQKYAKWLNPAGIDLVIHEWDARVGGRVRFDMPQPDGNKNPQEGVFHELVPFAKIVSGDADKTFLLTVRFVRVDADRTTMIVEAKGVPVDWHAPATVGWGQSFDHLERQIAGAPPTETGRAGGFTIERTFKAPPPKVWAMWTTKEGLLKWWAVAAKEMGYDFTVKQLDVRVGGGYAFGMVGNGHDLVNGGTYTVVKPTTHLAWTWHFDIFLEANEKPYDIPISVEFTPTPGGGTRMKFTQGPMAKPEFTEGSRQGVLKNFEKLAAALEE